MRKYLLTIAIILIAVVAMAAPVGQQKTEQIAEFFFHEHGGSGDLRFVQNSTFNHLHFYCGEDGKGFVIMAADDCVLPILGYSASNELRLDDMGPNARYWLEDYDRQIEWNINNNHETSPTVANEWARLEQMIPQPKYAPASTMYNTANLLTTTWAQDPYYNSQCPYDTDEKEYTVTGCVATAMGQIMKYWEFPTRGIGSYTYTDPDYGTQSANFADTVFDYAAMPNILTSSSTAAQVNAVALLLRRCGIGVEMYYGVDGSGATTCGNGTVGYTSAENAYKEYFKYMHTLHSVSLGDYTDSAWVALLKNEIDNGRPMQYSAGNEYTGGGHSFVCCGYDNTGKLYFNWGWGGYCDGYYQIGQLNPGSSHYNARNRAIIGIVPDTIGATQTTITLAANPLGAGTFTGAGTYTSYQDTVRIMATAGAGYLFGRWDATNTSNPYEFIANGGAVTHTAYFEKMHGDTLGYCYDANKNSYGGSYSSTRLWAIRLDSNAIAPRQILTRVQAYISEAGSHIIHICQGNKPSSSTLVLSDTVSMSTSDIDTWVDVTLSDSVLVNRALPLWIALEWTGSGYPRSYSAYRGNPDGAWKANSLSGTWSNYVTDDDRYLAWQIRGVFVKNNASFEVTVLTDDAAMGSVTGGGTYPYDTTITITATANKGFEFIGWNDGDVNTVRQIRVTSDTTFTAYFEPSAPTGLDVVAAHNVMTYVSERNIIVENGIGREIRIYDVTGKMVARKVAGSNREMFHAVTGVYFVRVNGGTQKVVVK